MSLERGKNNGGSMKEGKESVLLQLRAELVPMYELSENEGDIKEVSLERSTIIVGDGTYNGVFFPMEEIEKAYMTWDRQPININHSEQIEDEVGYITEPRFENGRITIQPMLNEGTAKYDVAMGYIKNRLKAGRIPEVSVGVWVTRNEEQYGDDTRIVARDAQGDHLAFVGRGACSPEDGCGVGLSKEPVGDNDNGFFTVMFNADADENVEKMSQLKKELTAQKIKKYKLILEEK